MSEPETIADIVNQVKADVEDARTKKEEQRKADEEALATQELARPAQIKVLVDSLFPGHNFTLPTKRQPLRGVHDSLPGIWYAQGELPNIFGHYLFLVCRDASPKSLEVWSNLIHNPQCIATVKNTADVKALIRRLLNG